MVGTIRLFLLAEGVSFAAASAIHSGVLVTGYEHRRAAIAEGVIGAVLLLGWGLTLARASETRPIGIAAQAFALLGTLVGLFTVAIGVGPQRGPDIAYHIAILAVLAAGLLVAAPAPAAEQRA